MTYMIIQYPEEIYPNRTRVGGEPDPLITDADIEKAYALGRAHGSAQSAQADPLAGFSNLTQAIHDGARIDWEKLDGRTSKCVHTEMGTLTKKFIRDHAYAEDCHNGWYVTLPSGNSGGWGQIFRCSWLGNDGWQLWVEGEIPVKTRTADELEPGIGLLGRVAEGIPQKMLRYDVYSECHQKLYRMARPLVGNESHNASEVEVIKVYGIGTIQSPKEEA